MDFIKELEESLGCEAIKEFLPMQPGDVYETQQALTAYLKSPEKDTLTEKYDQFIEKYMGACDGHSSERIAAMINQYMEEAKHE